MSDDLERELRVMLRERATRVGDDLEVPTDLDGRVRRLRSRRRLIAGGALAAAVLVAAGTVAVIVNRDRTPTSVQVQHPPTSPTRLVLDMMSNLVTMANPDGSVGHVVVGVPAYHTIVRPELVGDTLWYLVMAEPDFTGSVRCATLQRVPLGGGEPQTVVGRTYAFAVSPDGSRLAYGSAPGCGQDASDPQPRLLVRDVETGNTHELIDRRWSAHADANVRHEPFSTFPDPTIGWSPDGTQLVVGWQQDGHSSLALIDATAEGSISAHVATWPGFAPAFVGNALWYIEQPGKGAPERLARRDLGNGEVVSQTSPFSAGVSQLEPGPGGSLYALTGALAGLPSHLERWDHVHASEVVIQNRVLMRYMPSYIASG